MAGSSAHGGVEERVNQFLARLPDGVHSYPQCKTKGSVVREFVAGLPMIELMDALPGPVRPLVMHRPPAGQWFPEVHANVIYLAMREAFFETDAAMVSHAHECNKRLVTNPIARFMVRLFSWDRTVRETVRLWNQFHVGSQLTFEQTDDELILLFEFPDHLWPPLVLECLSTAFRAGIQLSLKADLEVKLHDAAPNRCRYRCIVRSGI